MKKENKLATEEVGEMQNEEIVQVTEAESASVTLVKQESKGKRFWRNNWEGWMFVLPLVIGLGLFTLYPMVQSLIWSFCKFYDGGFEYYTFVGFDNYIKMFAPDRLGPELRIITRNTLFYTFISVPLTLVTSYLIAVLVNMKIKGVGLFRVIYYLPCVIPGVVSGILWGEMFAPEGLFNSVLALFNAHSLFFISSEWQVAISSIFLMNLWSIGGGMILWLSAFKSIPSQLYEAAKIDGAGRFRQLVSITIPMSMSMIFFNVVTMLIGTLQYNGTLTFAAGGIGTDKALYMYGVWIYNVAFGAALPEFGLASAMSWVLLVFVGILTGLLFGSRKFFYMGDD